jgi:hypothetical protein
MVARVRTMLVRILQMESRDPRVPENCDFCTESETMTSGRPYLRPQAWPSYAQVLLSRVGLSDMRGSSSALVLWSPLSPCPKCPHPPAFGTTATGSTSQGFDRVSRTDAISFGVQFLKNKDMCVHIRNPLRAVL